MSKWKNNKRNNISSSGNNNACNAKPSRSNNKNSNK